MINLNQIKRYCYPLITKQIYFSGQSFRLIICHRFIERLVGWGLSNYFPDEKVVILLPGTRWVHQYFTYQSLWVFFLSSQGEVIKQQLLVPGTSGYCWRAHYVVECLPAQRHVIAQWLINDDTVLAWKK